MFIRFTHTIPQWRFFNLRIFVLFLYFAISTTQIDGAPAAVIDQAFAQKLISKLGRCTAKIDMKSLDGIWHLAEYSAPFPAPSSDIVSVRLELKSAGRTKTEGRLYEISADGGQSEPYIATLMSVPLLPGITFNILPPLQSVHDQSLILCVLMLAAEPDRYFATLLMDESAEEINYAIYTRKPNSGDGGVMIDDDIVQIVQQRLNCLEKIFDDNQ